MHDGLKETGLGKAPRTCKTDGKRISEKEEHCSSAAKGALTTWQIVNPCRATS
jgi:hypothetical protein